MRHGVLSGVLWGLDTVVLGMALAQAPFVGTAEAVAFAAVASAFLHDAACALWLAVYMGVRGRMRDTLRALRSRDGLVVMAGALLGGPIGMTGYLVAIDSLGPGYTAIISAFYPAFGALLSFLVLHERMRPGQVVALLCAVCGIMGMGWITAGTAGADVADAGRGLLGALLCVAGWGSEAVLCAWGMRGQDMDDQTALQIRETTSAIVYGVVVLPLFGAWHFTAGAALTPAAGIVALAALAGTASYLNYYRGISELGASRAMALNVSYSAWAVVFGLLLLGDVPSPAAVVCCVVILAGTVLAACDWDELFRRGTSRNV